MLQSAPSFTSFIFDISLIKKNDESEKLIRSDDYI
jgi:hypothetical protein